MEIGLREMIGHQVVVMGPSYIDNEKLHSVKLLGVEEAGIWIESPEVVEKVLGRLRKPSSAALAFFVPYTQITTIVAGFEPLGAE